MPILQRGKRVCIRPHFRRMRKQLWLDPTKPCRGVKREVQHNCSTLWQHESGRKSMKSQRVFGGRILQKTSLIFQPFCCRTVHSQVEQNLKIGAFSLNCLSAVNYETRARSTLVFSNRKGIFFVKQFNI